MGGKGGGRASESGSETGREAVPLSLLRLITRWSHFKLSETLPDKTKCCRVFFTQIPPL